MSGGVLIPPGSGGDQAGGLPQRDGWPCGGSSRKPLTVSGRSGATTESMSTFKRPLDQCDLAKTWTLEVQRTFQIS
jgi:hypothetical protein